MSRVEFRGTERYELLGLLGVGAMGVVYEALDRELGILVALKCLPSTSPEAALRFKREFRSLRDVHHENLVVLGELVSADEQLFFTMELIDGTDIVSYCRGFDGEQRRHTREPARADDATIDADSAIVQVQPWVAARPIEAPVDERRVRAAFASLTRGLMALHAANKVHRDVKPSNVLVTREGRVVLLDFGVVIDSAPEAIPAETRLVGTVGYMSPEQAARARVSFESDWYSVGVMLFEVLTQRLPFQGKSADVLRRKQTERPPRARDFAPALSPTLDDLCRRLLEPRGEDRPNGAQILQVLEGGSAIPDSIAQRDEGSPFVGRETELALLNRALKRARAGQAALVHIEGPSGTGKTALLRDFIAGTSASTDTLVLQGCCSEREYVPYRAVDGAMDALAEFIARPQSAGLRAALDPQLSHLVRAFPVFGRAAAAALASDVADPYVGRLNLFRALRAVLAAIREQMQVIVVLDDMQWADADSLALLSAVLRSPSAPPILVVAASRLQWSERGLLRAFGAESITLGNLPAGDAVALARLLLRSHPCTPDAERLAERVATEACGHPLFIGELVRTNLASNGAIQAQLTLDVALWSRVERLTPQARLLVQLVAVARGALSLRVLSRAAGQASDDATAFSDLLALRNEHLLELDGMGGASAVRTYHDRLSAAVLARLSEATRQEMHGAIAQALQLEPDADPEQLAVHFRGAGITRVAARHALRAAARAVEALAFEQAARLYQMALECWPSQPEADRIQESLGDALANAGLGPAAARAYLEASVTADEAVRVDLQRRAADQLFRAGHIDEAEPLIRRVLQHMGISIPDSLFWILMALLISRMRLLFTRVEGVSLSARAAGARELAELNACWSVAVGLSMVSNLRGACMQSRHLLLALKMRQRLPLIRALATEASYVAVRGQGNRRRAERLLRRAEHLSGGVQDPYADGFITLSRSICAFLMGEWSQSRALARAAERVFETRPAGAMWELASARTFGLWSHFYLGDLTALSSRVTEFIHEAETRGDRYAATLHRTGLITMVWLVSDEPHLAREQVLEAETGWSRATFDFQRYLNTLGHCLIDLYENAPELAHRRIVEIWPHLRRSQYLRIQNLRFEALYLRGVAAIGAAASGGAPALLREAERAASRIAREQVGWAGALASLLFAGVAHVRADFDAAARHWRHAEQAASAHDMALFAAAAAYRLALVESGGDASLEVSKSLAAPTLRAVREPARICQLLAPGARARSQAQHSYPGLGLRGRGMS